jgi:ketosteroid isomerase-like protein
MTANIDLVLRFIDGINGRSLSVLGPLMTEDHIFMDSLGNKIRGRRSVIQGWRHYFSTMPEHDIKCEEILGNDQTVAVFGIVCGTYASDGEKMAKRRWRTPAAWKATVRDGKIAEWQVYASNITWYDVMKNAPAMIPELVELLCKG